MDILKIKGARQHNLKNINLDIPKNKFVVMTGISGSGKSSLAFDTIYAEGQRRYVESLSAYARQFLGVMDKPDVDTIEGLSPSISIDQKAASNNPRSTVGTITEIYDFFRLLYARIGHPHCPKCNIEIRKLTIDEIVDKIVLAVEAKVKEDKIKPHTFYILSPVVREKKGEFKDLFDNLLAKGYTKVIVDGVEKNIIDGIDLIKTNKHSIYVSIYQFVDIYKNFKNIKHKDELTNLLRNNVEQALKLSDGLVILKNTTAAVVLAQEERLFSEKFSCPNCNMSLSEMEPRMFSFNSPLGACEHCKGIGTIYAIEPDLILNKNLTINEGGILPFNKFFFHETWYSRLLNTVCEEEGINQNIPINQFTNLQINLLLKGTNKEYVVHGNNRFGKPTTIYQKFDGIINELERRYFNSQSNDMQGIEIQRYMKEEICEKCKGKKLKPEILSITINKINIAELSDCSIVKLLNCFKTELPTIINTYEAQIAKPIFKEIVTRLTFLQNVGLSYLTISRTAKTLSGGELQRIRLASQIGTGLTGVLYVLDEPSIGLHPKDVSALINTLVNLKNLGNSLIVVEHDRETIESADHIVELGPKAGKNGGKVMFSGTLEDIKKSNTITGQYLSGKKIVPIKNKQLQQQIGKIVLRGANQFNLKNIDLEIPLGNLIAVTGVSGSGKSSLIVETLYPALKYYLDGYYQETMGSFKRLEGYQYVDRVYLVDQSPIGRTPRSNAATYTGFFDDIRELFATTLDAKSKGFAKGRFSFNVKGGRCEKCQGAGVIKIEMQFLADVYVTCDVCEGHRYNKETLEVKYKDKNIYDILRMTVDEACRFFENHPHIFHKLAFLQQTGLGYIEIGQGAPTFSGGEAQRIKLALELSRRDTGKTLYILDEPTTGLHFYDIENLMHTLHELVGRGNTVIVIEHNMDVIKNCQYIIDLGPDGGDKGGEIVYKGEIKGILKEKKSYTGGYLRKIF